MKRLRVVQDTRWGGCYYLPPSDNKCPHSINISRNNESDMEYACIILHEIGHAYYQHDFRDISTPPEKIIKEELEAWDYAKRCVKSKYYKFITDIIDNRIIN